MSDFLFWTGYTMPLMRLNTVSAIDHIMPIEKVDLKGGHILLDDPKNVKTRRQLKIEILKEFAVSYWVKRALKKEADPTE